MEAPLITVVIPCYNQGDYLAEAIESVLAQTHPNREVIVIDDGSTDETPEVAARYPEVGYIYQDNQGLSAARNTGISASRGEYLVFLDADDRLLRDALRIGYEILSSHPDCGFVSGHHYHIRRDGTLQTRYPQEPMGSDDPYLALLMNNYIGMHATVMYRRSVFETVGNFNTALSACEDYDLYLRVARTQPTVRHAQFVAEYRHHDANMSRDAILMIKAIMSVLKAQQEHIEGTPERVRAYRIGIHNWTVYYGRELVRQLKLDLHQHDWTGAWRRLGTLLRYAPFWLRGLLSMMPIPARGG